MPSLFPGGGDNLSVFGGTASVSGALEEVMAPRNRKEAHQLGQVCLAEALSCAKEALRILEHCSDLNREADLKAFISRDVLLYV